MSAPYSFAIPWLMDPAADPPEDPPDPTPPPDPDADNYQTAIPWVMDEQPDPEGLGYMGAIPWLMWLQTPRSDEDAILIRIPKEGLDIAKLRTSGTRDASTVLHGDAVWRPVTGAGAGFPFTQASASSLWVINHNLGYRPGVTVLRDGVTPVEALVTHPSLLQTRISFLTPISGTARLL